FDNFIKDIFAIAPGIKGASAYENAIEKFLSALLYPSLSFPVKQDEIHDGRKRIDITYVNDSKIGFFNWISRNYPASHIFVECKNYGKEVGNPELDQLSGRFSPSRGKLGILVVRSIENKPLLLQRCKDTATDHRGFILVLEDCDLKNLAQQRQRIQSDYADTLLYKQFKALIS